MFFKNLQVYRLPNFALSAEQLAAALAPHEFVPASSNELLRQGWASPRGNGQLVHTVNRQMLLQLKSEKKLLPATVINQVAKARAEEMEEAQGFAPGRKAMKELKERVADELLPKAFGINSVTNVWIDPVNHWLVVDAASPAKADEVIKLLLKAVDKLPLESLRVQRSPVGCMTEWLQRDESPAGFTVDQDATMRATGESKATVQYKRHTLEPEEVRRHIAAGKQCTRLAMTWDSKISFVLDESLAVKSIKPLDIIAERESAVRNDEERFDIDMMLMTGELAKMLADLVEALGGAAEGDAPVSRPAATARAAGAEPAKGDEPVREQRTVMSADDHIAGQLARRGMTMRDLEPKAAADAPEGDGSASDPLYGAAVEVVRTNQRASISLVQRMLRIGYGRAARLLEAMEGTVLGPLVGGNRALLAAPGVTP
jgi:recombination associated protein RdgC